MPEFIWPVSIRLIHWALAISITLNLFVLEEGDDPHKYLGYFALALVVIRQFIKIPYRAENRLAHAVHILIWLCVLGLAITGFMLSLDAFWANEALEDTHEIFSQTMMALISVHIIGLALHSIRTKSHSWLAMLNGKTKE